MSQSENESSYEHEENNQQSDCECELPQKTAGSYTVKELKRMAKAAGFRGYCRLRKDELIKLLSQQ